MQQTPNQPTLKLADVEGIWDRTLERVRETMPEVLFETWVQGAQPIAYDQGICTIGVRNTYVKSWLESRTATSFGEFLTREIKDMFPAKNFKPAVIVQFQVAAQSDHEEDTHVSDEMTIWNKVLNTLQTEIPRASFDTWVRDSQPLPIQDNVLKVTVRNAYTCDWLTTRLQDHITGMVKEIHPAIRSVQFVVEEQEHADEIAQAFVEDEDVNADTDDASSGFTAEIVDDTRYQEEAHPERIVAFDGYAMRLLEHGDLTPKDMSLWIGFRQAVYRHVKKDKGTAKNIPYWEVTQFAMMSRATYFRETTNKQDHIAGGLVEEIGVDAALSTNDRRFDNARRFRVHMAPRLTRRDCATIELLLEQGICEAVNFDEARRYALNTLQRLTSESPGEFLNQQPAPKTIGKNWPRSIAEIVRRVLDLRGDIPQDLHEAAEQLQNRILNGFGRVFITHHFLKVVVPALGLTHPQAWAIIALRDRCWYDYKTRTQLDHAILSGGLDGLGELVGVDRKTVKRWMNHAGFRMFVSSIETFELSELPDGWDPRTAIFTIRRDEPLRDEIADKMSNDPDKVSNDLDKVSNDAGQSEQRSRTKRATILDKVSNDAGQNEQRLNRFNKPLLNPKKPQGSPPPGFPPGKHGALPRAAVGNWAFWDFSALMLNNSVQKPEALLSANKKYGRDLKTLCQGFVSWLLYAHSELGGKLRMDPTALAVSRLSKFAHAGAGGDCDHLAQLPPHELKMLLDNDLAGMDLGDSLEATIYRPHFANLDRELKLVLYRRLYGMEAV